MKKFLIIFVLAMAVFFIVKKVKIKNDMPKTEKVLSRALASEVKTLDPIFSGEYAVNMEVSKIYECLLEYHYLKRPCELTPNLAKSMPVISADQLTYTFAIQKDVMFQDNACFPNGKGRALTAHDFVYSWKRVMDPKLQSNTAFLFEDKIQGLDAWRKQASDAAITDYTEEVAGLKALDDYTLQVTLTKPCPQFLNIVAMMGCAAVPHEAVTHYGIEFMNNPVGTGPFLIKSYDPHAAKIVYHKNPTFRDKRFPAEASEEYKHMLVDAGKKLPFVDKVETHIIKEEQSSWLTFQNKKLDILDISRGDIVMNIVKNKQLIPSMQAKGIQLFTATWDCLGYWVFNNAHPLFKNNIQLRRAIAMAFDYETNNQLLAHNLLTVDGSHIPVGMAGNQEQSKESYYHYDLEKARKLLAEAGYPGGKDLPEITVDIASSSRAKSQGEFFQQCMSKIGIKVKIVQNIWPKLTEKCANQSTMMHAMSWVADYPDAETFLQLFYGKTSAYGLYTYYQYSPFDAKYSNACFMQPSATRTHLYEKMNALIGQQVPAIPIGTYNSFILHHEWIKNFTSSTFHFGIEQYIDIDLEKK